MTSQTRQFFSVLIVLALLVSLCACGTAADVAVAADGETAEETAEPVDTAEEEPSEEEAEELDELQLAEKNIVAGIDYGDYNFLTEKAFYETLEEMLALQGLTMTRTESGNAYFYFNYDNVDSVKLLTISKTMEEIEADRARAQATYDDLVEAYEDGEDYAEDAENTEDAGEETVSFDPTKDVLNSEDYVAAFVLSAADTEMDQQIMFLVASAVWSIMNPNYDNSKDSFAYLKNALFGMYNNHGGAAVSTIDGVDNSYSFTIPGNAVEGWLGTDTDGNFILDITMYAEYDEIIDVAASGGTSLDTDSYSSVLSDVYG